MDAMLCLELVPLRSCVSQNLDIYQGKKRMISPDLEDSLLIWEHY